MLKDATKRSGSKWQKKSPIILRSVHVFAEAIRTLLKLGGGKICNILLVGPEDFLNPLTEIYDTILNPSSSRYEFVGAENKELMFLNDLRWSQEMISWKELLNLLEGQSIHLATPETHYATCVLITEDVPIFATNIAPIMFAGKGAIVEGENTVMEARWQQQFQLSVHIPLSKQKTVKIYAGCFCKLVFMGADT